MKYLYIDGDNIGLKIEQSFLNNNEVELCSINLEVINAVSEISFYLKNKNHHIIFAGADGIISKGENLDINTLLSTIRSIEPRLTFSIGVGSSLRNCYIALRYAKSFGKNIAIHYSDEANFTVIENEMLKLAD